MNARRQLHRFAIGLNLIAAGWWLWTALLVTSKMGLSAVASSGGLLWAAFVVPPLTAIAALLWPDTPHRT